jgi:hypothetical protein
MGLYDTITVSGEWCRCSEGHDLRGEPLQTKDLGSTMGDWLVAEELSGEPGPYGVPVTQPVTGTLSAYTFCRDCPAFLQLETWNILQAWVEFELNLDAGRLNSVYRISQDSAEWIASERAEGSIGPMPQEQAIEECKVRRGIYR